MSSGFRVAVWRLVAALLLLGIPDVPALARGVPKHLAPIPNATLSLMRERNMAPGSPILIRIYKKEAELEVWKKTGNGRYALLKSFPICRWSGQLGPKLRQGDRQAPEGFYSVSPRQMNPNSSYHLSFNLGFPNAFDKAHKASGSALMVHGACSSAGCYAMTNEGVEEVYALAREAFAGGQKAFQAQAFPFRMTARNMARHRADPHIAFWRQLKEGSDRFEATGEEPVVGVEDKRYAFAPSPDPAREALAVARLAEQEAEVAAIVERGSAAVRTTYADGGQHASFMAFAREGGSLGEVSRPEALALAGREVVITPARRRRTPKVEEATGAIPPAAAAAVAMAADPAESFEPAPEVELSLFMVVPMGYGLDAPPARPMLSGAAGILPAAFTGPELAARY